jgi:hypothetical protein
MNFMVGSVNFLEGVSMAKLATYGPPEPAKVKILIEPQIQKLGSRSKVKTSNINPNRDGIGPV